MLMAFGSSLVHKTTAGTKLNTGTFVKYRTHNCTYIGLPKATTHDRKCFKTYDVKFITQFGGQDVKAQGHWVNVQQQSKCTKTHSPCRNAITAVGPSLR